MFQSDPLSFLDEYAVSEESPGGAADVLSFLDEPTEPKRPSISKKTKNYAADEGGPSDALSFLDEPQESFLDKFTPKPYTSEKTSPEKSLRQNVLDIYRPEEKTAEQIKSMSLEEKMQHAEDLKNFRELQSGTGFAKGALSGLTFSASEHIPGLKPDEDDLMVGLGETVGSYFPIAKLYNFIGKPLVQFAAKSPVAKGGLMALARMTGFGVTGATHKAGKELVQGEVPEPKELLKEGAIWAGIDAALQSLGLGVAFSQSIERIAEAEGITAKEVLSKLWDSTKNYAKLKVGRSIKGEILPEDAEILFEQAKAAEAEGLKPELEIAAKEAKKPEAVAEPKPEIEVTEPEVKSELAIPEKPEELKWEYTREDFPTKEDAKAYLEHLQNSLKKAPEAHKPTLERDIRNLEELVSGFEKEEVEKAHPVEKVEESQLSVSEITDQIKSFPGTPKAPSTLNSDEILTATPIEKHFLVKDALDVLESIRGRKAGEIDFDKFFELQKQLVKYIETPTLESLKFADENQLKSHKQELKRRETALEAKTKVFKNSLKKLEGTVNGEPLLMSKTARGPEEELAKKQTQVPPKQTRPLQPVMGKKQAVARSKIIDLFRKAFTDPIRLGKISQKKASGIHKLWPKVTRLLKANDVETAAHEIGHNLHTTLYGGNAATSKEQTRNIESALAPYLNELKPLAHYEPWGMEGFAEFTRLYVTNPNVAKELAPNFYNKFENDLEAQYPEMKNALLEARDYYDQYLQGTPQSRIRAQTNYANDKGKLANIIGSVKKGLNLDHIKTQFLDDIFPAKRLVAEAFGIPLSEVENLKDEKNLYRSLRVLKGAVGKADVFVLHETFKAKTLDKINGSLKDILKKLPNEEAYREFNDYLIARRSLEKAAQKVETGINFGDAVAVEAQLRSKYGDLAKELDRYNDALLNYAKDSGLLSGKQYVAIKENNLMYVPFQRVMEAEKGGAATGAGRLQAGKPIKGMKGSTRDIIAPIESVLKNTYSIIINSEKNLSGQVLANLSKMPNLGPYVERVPTPIKLKGKVEGEQVSKELAKRFEREGLSDLIEYDQNGKPVLREDISDAIPEAFLRFGAGQYPPGENIITVYFNGKPAYFEVSPEISEMWSKGTTPYVANLLTKILRFPARTLRAGAILNPRFMQKNAVRDTWGGWLFSKYGKSIKDPGGLFIETIYSPLAMLATAARKGPLYVKWLKAGGGMSTMQSLDRDAVARKLEEVRHGYKPHQVMKWLRQVAEISEEANRLAEFDRALKAESKTRLGAEIAAFAARDLSVDFAKMGLQVKALNQIIPFFNATIQGGDKLLRTIVNPKDRKNFLPRVLGFIVLPSLMLAWLNKDDERVKEFYEEEKDFNFITFVGDQAIKIPVPFETGVIAHGLTQRMFNYFMKEDPEAFEQFMGSVSSAMLPNMSPTFANPFLETWANKNFFTGARIVPVGKEGLISKFQYKNNTSSTARLLGRAMAYMLGQETRSKVASPAIIDHFITSWTGGLGRMMVNISDASLEAAGLSDKIPGPQQAITERLGLDAFTARFPRSSTRSIEKFYDNYQDATAKRKSFKHAEKIGLEGEEELGAAKQRFEKIYDYNTLQKAYKAIQQSQKEINNIWNDPSIDPETKKQFIDELYLQQIEFAKAANEDIRQYRLAQ